LQGNQKSFTKRQNIISYIFSIFFHPSLQGLSSKKKLATSPAGEPERAFYIPLQPPFLGPLYFVNMRV
jgi:hypothetical protein